MPLSSFHFYGLIRQIADESLVSKGATHCLEVKAAHYHGYEHLWGEFGKGFDGLASFHED